MGENRKLKPVVWISSSKRDLKKLPKDVRTDFGHALHQAQNNEWPNIGRVFKGCGGASVIELRQDYKGDTFRAVYAVKYEDVIYVLHVFQKKSKHGIATPKPDIELIYSRLKLAEEDWKERKGKNYD